MLRSKYKGMTHECSSASNVRFFRARCSPWACIGVRASLPRTRESWEAGTWFSSVGIESILPGGASCSRRWNALSKPGCLLVLRACSLLVGGRKRVLRISFVVAWVSGVACATGGWGGCAQPGCAHPAARHAGQNSTGSLMRLRLQSGVLALVALTLVLHASQLVVLSTPQLLSHNKEPIPPQDTSSPPPDSRTQVLIATARQPTPCTTAHGYALKINSANIARS